MRHLALAFLLCAGLLAAPARAQAMGYVPIAKERYEEFPLWQRPAVVVPPAAQVDLRPLMPPVGDQGKQWSCVGWAVAYACGSYVEGMRRGRKPRVPSDREAFGPCALSPAYVYNQIRAPQGGSYIHEALEVWRREGLVSLERMPYSDRDDARLPTAEMRDEAREFRIRGYGRLRDCVAVRAALAAYRPVIIGMRTTERFMEGRGVYGRTEHERSLSRDGKPHGGHALCLVAYDDGRRAFLAQNSWGPQWGEGGYCWLGYDLFERIGPGMGAIEEAWAVRPSRLMNPAAYEALVPPDARVPGVTLFSHGTLGSDGWSFQVGIAPICRRFDDIESVAWSFLDDGVARTVVSRESARNFELNSTQSRPGFREIRALIRFRDGSTGETSHGVVLLEKEE